MEVGNISWGVMDMIKTIIRVDGDMVMVFDENGEELPEYQGRFYDVKDSILADASPDSVFKRWTGYVLQPQTVSRESWKSERLLGKFEIFSSLDFD